MNKLRAGDLVIEGGQMPVISNARQLTHPSWPDADGMLSCGVERCLTLTYDELPIFKVSSLN